MELKFLRYCISLLDLQRSIDRNLILIVRYRTMKILFLILTSCIAHIAQSQQTFSVYFDTDKSTLSPEEEQNLHTFLKSEIDLFEVIAYCDTTGSIIYNDALAKKRLNTVRNFLSKNDEFKTQSLGERHEMKNTELRNQRRVDILFYNVSSIEEIHEEIVIEKIAPVEDAVSDLKVFMDNPEQKEVVIQTTILFYNRSGMYLPESKEELDQLYVFMKKNPDVSAHIRGHICCNPYTEWDEISQARARTVAIYLIENGINKERITFKGYGTSLPYRSPEITEEDRKLNRRVDVVFTRE